MDFDEHARNVLAQFEDSELEREDLAVAIHLSWTIGGYDRLALPDHEAADIMLAAEPHDDDIAQYEWNAGGVERYVLYIPGMRQAVRAEALTTVLDTAYLPASRDYPLPSMMECVIGIGVHEVRHRIQVKRGAGLGRWTPDMRAHGLLGSVLDQVRALGRWHKHSSSPLLPFPREEMEFDAHTVQLYVLHRLDVLEAPEQVAELILSEA